MITLDNRSLISTPSSLLFDSNPLNSELPSQLPSSQIAFHHLVLEFCASLPADPSALSSDQVPLSPILLAPAAANKSPNLLTEPPNTVRLVAEPSVRDMEWRTGLGNGGSAAAAVHSTAMAVAVMTAALASAVGRG